MFVNRELPRQIDYFVLFTLGQFSYWERDYARALTAIDQAIVAAEAGGSGEQPEGLAYAYFYRGNMHAIYRQDRPAAIADYTRALGLLPDFANAAFNLGGLAAHPGQHLPCQRGRRPRRGDLPAGH